MTTKRIGAALATGVCMVALAVPAHAQQRSFDIPAGNLKAALDAYGRQAGQPIIYRAEDVRRAKSRGFRGAATSQAALEAILAGSGFTIQANSSGSLAVVWGGNGGVADAAASSPGDEDSSNTDIVVTAQKREERLQDVPVPVTVVSGAALSNTNQVKLQDYFNRVPSLSVSPGSFHALQLSIRGLTTGLGNPTVGIVVDDIPFGASKGTAYGLEAPDIDPSELDHVEVLRGPQGTLYGASSMGGLLKFVTKDPNVAAFSGRIQGGLSVAENGAEAGYFLRGGLNLPVNETLAVRVSGFTRRDPGYIDNPVLGIDGVNKAYFHGGRVSALWKPSDDLSVKLSALVQRSDARGSSDAHVRPGLDDLEQDSVRDSGAYKKTVQAYSAVVTGHVGGADLVSLTGYNVSSFNSVVDFSASIGPGSIVLERYRTRKFSQELRVTVPLGEHLEWLIGGYYTHEDTPTAIQRAVRADRATGAETGANLVYTNAPQAFEEYAAFTNLTVRFSDRFDIQLGARQSKNRQRYRSVNLNVAGSPPQEVHTKDDAFTYLITPRLRLNPDVMLYARFASGYRPGGPNTNTALFTLPTASYGPDRTRTYELGVKANALDKALSIDGSLYRIDWSDIQLQILSGGFTYYTNGATARSQGAELSFELRPTRQLTLSGWGALNWAELSERLPVTATVYGAKGDRLPFSSRFSGSVSADYAVPITSSASINFGTTINYVGDRLSTFRGLAAGAPLPRQVFPSYTRWDLRAGFKSGNWSLDVFANNVTDKRGVLQGGLGQSNPAAFYYITPRTIGLAASKSF